MLKIKDVLKFVTCYFSVLPLITYLLCNFCVTNRVVRFIQEDSSKNRFIMQTYKWSDGNYFMSQGRNPNIGNFYNNKYIYIRNISGKSPEKVFSKYISGMIQTELLFNIETVNAYGVEGELIPTDEFCDSIKVFDLYVDRLYIVSQINRSNIGEVFLPLYELVILDYKIFSNIFLDFAFMLLCSGGIYTLINKIINNLSSIDYKIFNDFVLIYFSIFFSVFLFLGFAYLIIKILYL